MKTAGGRWRQGMAVAAACAALTALSACTARSSPDPSDGSQGGTAVLPARAGAALGGGTLYLLLGNENVSANLWQVTLPSGRARQLTFNPSEDGVSNFSASSAGLVLGDARTSVDLTEIMQGGKPRLLSGGIGDSPQIDHAGQIAVAADNDPSVKRGPWSQDRLLLWDHPTAHYRTVYRARPLDLISEAWNPAGTQVLLSKTPDDDAYTRLLVVSLRGGTARYLAKLPAGGPNEYAWGPYGLAIGYLRAGRPEEVLTPSGRVRARIPAGWIPGCWNPSGSALLVMTHNQRRIGLWRPAQSARVQELGALPTQAQALQECAWTSRPAAGI